MTISVGLVGFGLSARTLQLPLILAAGMSVSGVVTRQVPAVRELLPGARVLPDLEALLALQPLDLVVIGTPNHLHCAQALLALEHGKHVVVDKPLARTTLEADRLIAAAAHHHRKLAVFHNRRWDSDFLTIEKILAENRLGPIVSFEARWDRYRPAVSTRWREHSEFGGGMLFDLGSHLIDQSLCLFGMPQWLQADVFAQRPGAMVDDGFELRMGKDNLRISLGVSSIAADHALRYRIHGLEGSYRKSGMDPQEAQLAAGVSPHDDAFGVEPQTQWGRVARDGSGEHAVGAERGRWLEFYQAMRQSIEADAPVPVSAQQARKVLAIIEAARRSNQDGRRIEL
ncbi:MAG TPA: Gfo/Idh/MocA family oxidoreductase [Steroidobacteraceae bacterium]